MPNSPAKILIETMVRKGIKDLKRAPKQTIRNLVDMALQFSESHFHRQFFQVAQTMLENKNSCYYALIPAVVADIDPEVLVTLGMNIGYNSCTEGAKTIREVESTQGFNVPWSILMHIDSNTYLSNRHRYECLIQEGKELGIYTWQIRIDKQPEVVLDLAAEHEDCAFILYCDPADLTLLFLDQVASLKNIMPVIRYNEYTNDVYAALWDSGILYSIYHEYTEDDLDAIESGEFFSETEQFHPLFTALQAHPDCPIAVQNRVYRAVWNARQEQIYLTIPWEVTYDNCYIDSIISGDACSLYLGKDGSIRTLSPKPAAKDLNLFRNSLPEILRTTFPK